MEALDVRARYGRGPRGDSRRSRVVLGRHVGGGTRSGLRRPGSPCGLGCQTRWVNLSATVGQFSRRLNRAARLEHQRAQLPPQRQTRLQEHAAARSDTGYLTPAGTPISIITAEALGLFSGEKLGRV